MIINVFNDYWYIHIFCTDGINEAQALCQLHVRLVTEEMLMSSVTVRLYNLRHSTFLSTLYDLFLSALASIIPTTEDNVFIINVVDDTDVGDRILNVSFSVRKYSVGNHDEFYSPQWLREKVYLQRVLLAKLSTLEVGSNFQHELIFGTYTVKP